MKTPAKSFEDYFNISEGTAKTIALTGDRANQFAQYAKLLVTSGFKLSDENKRYMMFTFPSGRGDQRAGYDAFKKLYAIIQKITSNGASDFSWDDVAPPILDEIRMAGIVMTPA